MGKLTRYRIDAQQHGIIDEKKKMLVCAQSDAQRFFGSRPNSVKKQIEILDQEIQTLEEQKTKIQLRCRHTNATHQYRSDVGNWCKNDDRYWIEFRCYDCGKFWTEDQ